MLWTWELTRTYGREGLTSSEAQVASGRATTDHLRRGESVERLHIERTLGRVDTRCREGVVGAVVIAQCLDDADHREVLEERELARPEVIKQRAEGFWA